MGEKTTIAFQMLGDADDVIKEQEKVLRQNKRLIDQLQRSANKSDKFTKKNKAGFNKMAAAVGKVGIQFIALNKLVSLGSKGLEKYRQRQTDIANGFKQAEKPLAKLAQLAGGDVDKLQRLISESKKTRTTAGVSVERAADLQFTLESLGISKSRELFARIEGITDAKLLAEGAGTIQQAFGKEKAGTIPDVLSKLFRASQESNATLAEFGPNVSTFSKQVAQIGGGIDESLASLAIFTRAIRSPEVAAVQLGALSDVLAKKGLGGLGLIKGIEELIRSGVFKKPEPEQIKFFGEKRARKGALGLVQDLQEIKRLTAEIAKINRKEAGKDVPAFLENVIKSIETIPELALPKKLRLAEQGAATISELTEGQREIVRQTETFRRRAELQVLRGGGTGVGASIRNILEGIKQSITETFFLQPITDRPSEQFPTSFTKSLERIGVSQEQFNQLLGEQVIETKLNRTKKPQVVTEK